MSRVHIAVFDRTPQWTIMKEDIYTSLLHWLSEIGHVATIELRSLERNAINIIVGLQYLTPQELDDIANSTYEYGVFDVEYIAAGMVNFKPETSWLFADRARPFLSRCRFFLSYFEESARLMADLGILSRRIMPGYVKFFEPGATIGESDKTIDVYFFGNVDAHRAGLLRRVERAVPVLTQTPSQVTPLFLRNARAARAKIVLSLGRAAPFTHIGPMRLVEMAHLRTFVLSEMPARPQPELDGLCAWWTADEDPGEVVRAWLMAPERRRARAEAAFERVKAFDPLTPLAEALEAAR
ncbi:hypothetical protein [Prosthecomicrobium pneumaticum]|uniref:Glycosyltransferase family 1 protein n=1 Tax=Prosthecomicrobium pneumaticum TaxID=81895 RepID=A0A7W9FQB6_9HYPH|nr:hypothetical protein [Prosthecomicrobium pneumaticum]MBB5754816.1 hypothetical protein [Prosthecomicrobium pneumaticum]